MDASRLIGLAYTLPALLIAVIIHEYSHGRVAELVGDSTARHAGRLTFNPLPHIDPFGSVLLPLLLIVSGSPIIFASAKPVPINPAMFRRGRKDLLWVGLAGPASNLVLAAAAGLLTAGLQNILPWWLLNFLVQFVVINCVLALFNLIPFPPLDGSRIVEALLPLRWAQKYASIEPYGFVILFAFLFFFSGVFSAVLWPAVAFLARLFLPGVAI
jgi:Zn-dependent protease